MISRGTTLKIREMKSIIISLKCTKYHPITTSLWKICSSGIFKSGFVFFFKPPQPLQAMLRSFLELNDKVGGTSTETEFFFSQQLCGQID